MEIYTRANPLFSLCGLNCGLCPRYHTQGKSKCPGCGGKGFHLLHPSCAVITCSKKHGAVAYCFQCSEFPCKRYIAPSKTDSFITDRNVTSDIRKAKEHGVERYQQELNEKISFLTDLLAHYNDGKRKNFYCTAVNLLELSDLNELKEYIQQAIEEADLSAEEKTTRVVSFTAERAKQRLVDLTLRK